ncbi:MAG: hypothetical protein P1V97_12260, partial [Planctomycetota bacterium]|nr:hypothetical protein [Planctomycetota bacterium]
MPVLIIMFSLVVLAFILVLWSEGLAKKTGPASQLGGRPCVEGELTGVMESTVLGVPPKIVCGVKLFFDGEALTGHCEILEQKWGKIPPLELFVYKRGSKVEGRFPKGKTWNTVEGFLNDERGELT